MGILGTMARVRGVSIFSGGSQMHFQVNFSFRFRIEPHMVEFKYLMVLFTSEGKIQHNIDRIVD